MRSPDPNEVSGLRHCVYHADICISAWLRSKETFIIAAGPA